MSFVPPTPLRFCACPGALRIKGWIPRSGESQTSEGTERTWRRLFRVASQLLGRDFRPPSAAASPRADASNRLAELKSLLDNELITAEEYAIRLSVGIEDVLDLLSDLEQALESGSRARRGGPVKA